MAEERTNKVALAKLWEQTERWHDMALCMKEVVEMGGILQQEERNLLSVAYKNKASSRRCTWRIVSSAEQNAPDGSYDRQAATWLREKVETELKEMCDEVLALLDNFLIPRADKELEDEHDEESREKVAESYVFYRKMKGDYHRYQAEISEGEEKEGVVKDAQESYGEALKKAAEELKPTHPIRLGVALNFSVFHYEVTKNTEEACRLTKDAFDAAISELDTLNDASYKDSTIIMHMLRDNLTVWTSENEEQGED
ncbi:14-3-3 protein gamma-like [Branchiostoma floridae]|uniref:14-3-3 protein gamma-like n=1 Tax=Branchiostoma floridae TaxID=7739 RepID=A0A9J7K6W8_BRAFL|nr:14-3-3 protein gamma-like [Branchiostoma floridae]